jgi:hypothetical protein
MNLKVEDILKLVIAFIIGWFVMKTVMGYINNSVVKVVGGKHTKKDYTDCVPPYFPCPGNPYYCCH